MPYAIMNEGEHVDGWATWRPSDRRRRERRLPSRSGYVGVRSVGVPQPLPNVEPSSILVPRSSVQRMGTRCAIRLSHGAYALPRDTRARTGRTARWKEWRLEPPAFACSRLWAAGGDVRADDGVCGALAEPRGTRGQPDLPRGGGGGAPSSPWLSLCGSLCAHRTVYNP